MIETAILAAALMAALFLIGFLIRALRGAHKTMEKSTQRWMSARKTLTATKEQNEELTAEVAFLKSVLFDVAKGEAHVWIEDDELRAARKPAGGTQVH